MISSETTMSIISTHSLTRRLTLFMDIIVYTHWYFNSQPHKEADLKFKDVPFLAIFQLTASQGG